DPTAGMLYSVDFVSDPPPQHHELFGVALNDGTVRYHLPIDPGDANPLTHQQRGALALSKGTLYIPYGGLFGDCGEYHGWVVAAGAPDGHQRAAYRVPTNREGAIWAAPAI